MKNDVPQKERRQVIEVLASWSALFVGMMQARQQFYAAISQHSHFNTGQVGLSVGEPSYFHRILVGLKSCLSIHNNTMLLPPGHFPGNLSI